MPRFNTDLANSAGNYLLKNIDGARSTYVFDAEGNQQIEIVSGELRTTTVWDYENQPTQYRLPTGGRVTYVYNADFRRVREEA